MNKTNDHCIQFSGGAGRNRCLSCGTSENMKQRRYCSVECRQRLRYNLNLRTGLLRALNTRYATFYFTDSLIVLDVLPYGSEELFSYLFPRTSGRKPVEDFCTMSNFVSGDAAFRINGFTTAVRFDGCSRLPAG